MWNCPKFRTSGWICWARLTKEVWSIWSCRVQTTLPWHCEWPSTPSASFGCSGGSRTRSCSMSASRRFEWKANSADRMFSSDTGQDRNYIIPNRRAFQQAFAIQGANVDSFVSWAEERPAGRTTTELEELSIHVLDAQNLEELL